jgi:triacylglycerol lipase
MSQVRSTERPRAEQVCPADTQGGPRALQDVLDAARAAVQTVRRAAVVHANEAAMMMSTVAMAPLRLLGGGYDTPSSFLTVKALTAPTTRPVVLVHGFAGSKSSWALVANALKARGVAVEAMSYPPVGTSVQQLADRLVAEVERILVATGTDKVHLVGHSLGGVVIAQAIADRRLTGRVDTVITLGSPFGGSPWAGVLPFVEIVRELRTGSPLLRRLASAPLPDGVRWLSLTAALDIIVPGLRAVPSHAQAETITFDGVGHLGMLLSRQVIGCIAAALCAQEPATAREAPMRLLPSAS